MSTAVTLREVGLRDGLQGQARFVPTDIKLDWVRREAAAGVREIEVTSYVPVSLIPQFADAQAVTHGALAVPGLTGSALVPNRRGAERGLELGAHKLNFVMSVSRTHNEKNVRRPREASLADFAGIVDSVRPRPDGRRPLVCGGLSTAIGYSYEGRIKVDDVRRWAMGLAEAGADELMSADTLGDADPALVRRVFKAVQAEVGTLPLAAHFHDTHGTGLANVLAALECGITRFDASLTGLGGCQFTPGASGNIVMEDLCFMLEAMGVSTGIDIQQLLAVRQVVGQPLQDMPLCGAVAKAGLPTNYHASASALAA